MRIITIGLGTEKGGTIPLKKNGVVQSYQRDNNDEVVVTKLNRASLETIAKATKGGYVNGNNTKEVLAYVKSSLDNIQKPNLSRRKSDFQSQFQWFLGFAFVLLFLFCWKRKRMGEEVEFNEEK
jgi:Ca-activated chloride channel family protein